MYTIIKDALTTDLSRERPVILERMLWFDEPFKEYQKQIFAHTEKRYDLSSMIGFEEWGHIAGMSWLPTIHQDKDEKHKANTGEVILTLCSCIYYHRIRDLKGANLVLYGSDNEEDIIEVITPEENMLVLLDPGIWHGVSEYHSGTRATVNINPWSHKIQHHGMVSQK